MDTADLLNGNALTAPSQGNTLLAYGNAISNLESGGRYDVVTDAGKGRKALGKYQVLDSNIPEWTQAALGQRLTPEQFLASPAAQDKVFQHQFGSYLDKYGNPSDAASAWHSGRPLAQALDAQDSLGTRTPDYVRKFNSLLSAKNNADPSRWSSQDVGMPAPDTRSQLLDFMGATTKGSVISKLLGLNDTPRYQTWPEQLVRSAFSTPHDALTGQLGPAGSSEFSVNAIPGAQAMAGALMGPGAGRAALSNSPGLGIFGGKTAATYDPRLARFSANLENGGGTPAEAWRSTGYSKNFPDNQQRFEINDSKAVADEAGLSSNGKYVTPAGVPAGSPRLGQVLDHSELYKAYPELKDAPIFKDTNLDAAASYNPFNGSITVNPDRFLPGMTLKSVLLHEVQHKIDNKEGFSRGASPEEFLGPNATQHYQNLEAGLKEKWPRVQEVAKEIGAKYGVDLNTDKLSNMIPHLVDLADAPKPEGGGVVNSIVKDLYDHPETGEYLKGLTVARKYLDARSAAMDQYKRTAGEVGARNVQTRANWSEQGRLSTPPWETEDVARPLQVHRGSVYGVNDNANSLTLEPKGIPVFNHKMFNLKKDDGSSAGWVTISSDDPKNLLVSGISAHADGPNSLGAKEMMSLIPEVKKYYPNAETVRGHRISGARRGPASDYRKLDEWGTDGPDQSVAKVNIDSFLRRRQQQGP